MRWQEFIEKYNTAMKKPTIPSHEWFLYQKELWAQMRKASKEDFENADCKYLPIYCRWWIVERHPHLLKKLLIDTYSYEKTSHTSACELWEVVTDAPDIYFKKYLKRVMFQQYTPWIKSSLRLLLPTI